MSFFGRFQYGMLLTLAALLSLQTLPAAAQRNKKPEVKKGTDTATQPEETNPLKPAEKSKLDEQLKGLKYREIGPFRGGRSLTASGIPGDPNVYYFGSTG